MNQAVVLNSVYSFDRTPCSRFQLKKKKREIMTKQLLTCVKMIQDGIISKGRGGEASLT